MRHLPSSSSSSPSSSLAAAGFYLLCGTFRPGLEHHRRFCPTQVSWVIFFSLCCCHSNIHACSSDYVETLFLPPGIPCEPVDHSSVKQHRAAGGLCPDYMVTNCNTIGWCRYRFRPLMLLLSVQEISLSFSLLLSPSHTCTHTYTHINPHHDKCFQYPELLICLAFKTMF